MQLFGEIVSRVGTDKPMVALTFDNGPSARFTQEILTILKDRNVTSTFFLTGKKTEENVLQVRAIVAGGHEIGSHSYSHSNMTLMGQQKSKGKLSERTRSSAQQVTKAKSRSDRPMEKSW